MDDKEYLRLVADNNKALHRIAEALELLALREPHHLHAPAEKPAKEKKPRKKQGISDLSSILHYAPDQQTLLSFLQSLADSKRMLLQNSITSNELVPALRKRFNVPEKQQIQLRAVVPLLKEAGFRPISKYVYEIRDA